MQSRQLLFLVTLAASVCASATEPLVGGDWLEPRLDDERVVVLDVRNRIDGGSREVYAAGHVPGAVYSDYLTDGWRTTVDGVIAMLPPVLLALLAQRYIVRGLTLGAVRG